MKAAAEWETPQDLKGVRSLLGFANYYRHFVPRYAEFASTTDIPYEKRCTMGMGIPQRQEFQSIKEALCNAPLLQYPNPSLPYVVVTDACEMFGGLWAFITCTNEPTGEGLCAEQVLGGECGELLVG